MLEAPSSLNHNVSDIQKYLIYKIVIAFSIGKTLFFQEEIYLVKNKIIYMF